MVTITYICKSKFKLVVMQFIFVLYTQYFSKCTLEK